MSAVAGIGLTCDEVEDALGAYALNALDADEVSAIDEHLASCERCRRSLQSQLETVGVLAALVIPVAPSSDVRRRLMAAASSEATISAQEPISFIDARTRRLRRLLAAVSVAAALLLVGIGMVGMELREARDDRNESQNVAQLLSTYISSGGQVVTLQTQPAKIYEYTYEGKGSLLLAPGKEPVVVVAECPKSGDHLTYWVWFSREGERTGAGKLTVGDDGSGWLSVDPQLALDQFDTIGITVVVGEDDREDVLVAPLSANLDEG
ncbi:MAG: anti-sigma factor [Thermomicrobiales bacterium]|nr:anti-sigma factor [Thermomicrobiales bacterium]